jgi:hypothetical protein
MEGVELRESTELFFSPLGVYYFSRVGEVGDGETLMVGFPLAARAQD